MRWPWRRRRRVLCWDRTVLHRMLFTCNLEAGHSGDHAEVRWAHAQDPIDTVAHSWPRALDPEPEPEAPLRTGTCPRCAAHIDETDLS